MANKHGRIAILRWNSNNPETNGTIQIQIEDENHNDVITIVLTPEEFANAITGKYETCKFKINEMRN